jgi:Zn-dependent protease/CBS domain-containing protein
MTGRAIPLGRVAGIPIRLDSSWFLIFALVTWTLAVGYYPAEFKDWPGWEYWVMGALTAIALFVSVLLHELSHSLVARALGTSVRSITLFIFGGVSQLGAGTATATRELLIAAAGPAASLFLALGSHLLEPAVAGVAPALGLVKYLAYINLMLGLFNLIPGFPLDGGRVFKALVWAATHDPDRATRVAGTVGRIIGYLFVLLGVWQILGGNLVNGLWISFIGWFLENAAVSEMQGQAILGLLAGHRVREAMRPDYVEVSANRPLQDLVDGHVLGQGRRSLLVERDGRLIGLLTLHQITRQPRSTWRTVTAEDVMIPRAAMRTTRRDADLRDALEKMDRDGVNQLPVVENDHTLGMISREDIISFLRSDMRGHS